MLEIRINPDKTVEIPQAGLFYLYGGKPYVVLQTTMIQEITDDLTIPDFSVTAHILPIDDNGDDISGPDNPPMTVNADKLTKI